MAKKKTNFFKSTSLDFTLTGFVAGVFLSILFLYPELIRISICPECEFNSSLYRWLFTIPLGFVIGLLIDLLIYKTKLYNVKWFRKAVPVFQRIALAFGIILITVAALTE